MQVMWLTDHMMAVRENNEYSNSFYSSSSYIESKDERLLHRSGQYHDVTQSGYCSAVVVMNVWKYV